MYKRRRIHFDTLEGVLEEARALLERGYRRHGSWSLGTMADHLGRAMIYSCEGFPGLWPRPVRAVLRVFCLSHILARRRLSWRFPSPIRVNGETSDQDGVEYLRRGIEAFQWTDAAVHPHIILGKLTRAQWLQFHLWHCEHHFSFLIPASQ